MNEQSPDFWEWVKNKIKEKEKEKEKQQEPLYVEIQPPSPTNPPIPSYEKQENVLDNLYEDINDDIVIDILKSKAISYRDGFFYQ